METVRPHPWPTVPKEAMALQRALASRVERADRLGTVARIAGVDVAFAEEGALTRAAVVVLAWPGLAVVEEVRADVPTRFPYVPGLLSFREVPAILVAFGRLGSPPDLVMVDGHGLAHPRRFGIACHLGVALDLPAIGVAKSRLVGKAAEPGPEKGDWTPLGDGDEIIGRVLRSRKGVKPLYISPGHRVTLATATDWVLCCLGRYRLPEPTRLADKLSKVRS